MVVTMTFKDSFGRISDAVRQIAMLFVRAPAASSAPRPFSQPPGVFGLLAGIDRRPD